MRLPELPAPAGERFHEGGTVLSTVRPMEDLRRRPPHRKPVMEPVVLRTPPTRVELAALITRLKEILL